MRRRSVLAHAVLAAGILLRASAAAEPRVFELAIRDGVLAENARVIRVRQGDDVTPGWTTDWAVTIHLHGYDLEQKLTPDTPASMRLTARATGRFPVSVHPHRPGEAGTHGRHGYRPSPV